MKTRTQITKLRSDIFVKEDLEGKINSITEPQRGYIRRIFNKMAHINPANAQILDDYLIAVGNDTNPSNNTGSTGSTVGLTGQPHHHKGSNVRQAETNNDNSRLLPVRTKDLHLRTAQ